jgi:hypothetical protein
MDSSPYTSNTQNRTEVKTVIRTQEPSSTRVLSTEKTGILQAKNQKSSFKTENNRSNSKAVRFVDHQFNEADVNYFTPNVHARQVRVLGSMGDVPRTYNPTYVNGGAIQQGNTISSTRVVSAQIAEPKPTEARVYSQTQSNFYSASKQKPFVEIESKENTSVHEKSLPITKSNIIYSSTNPVMNDLKFDTTYQKFQNIGVKTQNDFKPYESDIYKNYRKEESRERNSVKPDYSKSIGTFGFDIGKSALSQPTTGVTVSMQGYLEELSQKYRRLAEQHESLKYENQRLKLDSEALIICKGRLEEKESEKSEIDRSLKFMQSSMKELKEEYNKSCERNRQLNEQLNEIFTKMPGKFHMGSHGNKILSAEEWELEQQLRDAHEKILVLQKEKDKLFTQNYEYRKMLGEHDDLLNDSDDNLVEQRYQNSLQSANSELQKVKKKLSSIAKENELLRNELNILRGVDSLEQDEVKRKLTRGHLSPKHPDSPTDQGQRVSRQVPQALQNGRRAPQQLQR